MDRDFYSNKINVYYDCIDFIRHFKKPNQEIGKEEIGNTRMDIKSILETLKEIDAIEVDVFYYKSNENTIKYKYNRYFENKIDDLEAARSRDILSEKSANSAEESAIAAKVSAQEATKASNRFWLTVGISVFAVLISLGMLIFDIIKHLKAYE